MCERETEKTLPLRRQHKRFSLLGETSMATIESSLGSDADAFADETADFAQSYGDRTLTDYALFQDLLDEHGFDLGYRPSRPLER